MATKKSNVPAKRTPTKQLPAYMEIEAKLGKTEKALREARQEVRRPKTVEAFMDSGFTIAGASAVGFAKGATGVSDVMGVPVEVAGIIPIVLGGVLDQPWLISLGTGPLAAYSADYWEEMGADLFGDAEEEGLE